MRPMTLFRIVALLILTLPQVALAMYQRVASVSCPDGKFVIEGRVNANIKFIRSQVRYRYRGIELTGINYDQYPYLLRNYLYDDIKPDRIYELSTPYRFNPTIYLPPGRFKKEEFERLADCLNRHQDVLSRAPSKTLRGLLYWVYPVTSSVMVNGIARLVYAPPPFRGIYQDSSLGLLIVIERGSGRVLLMPIPGFKSPALGIKESDRRETVLWGKVYPKQRMWGKPRLSLRPLLINGKIFDGEMAKNEYYRNHLNGRYLHDDYHVLP